MGLERSRLKGAPIFGLERFGQNEISVKPVDPWQDARSDEGHAQPVVSEPAAEGRAEDKAEPESRSDNGEIGGAFFRRADIGDVSRRGGKIGSADPRENSPEEKPRQGGVPGRGESRRAPIRKGKSG